MSPRRSVVSAPRYGSPVSSVCRKWAIASEAKGSAQTIRHYLFFKIAADQRIDETEHLSRTGTHLNKAKIGIDYIDAQGCILYKVEKGFVIASKLLFGLFADADVADDTELPGNLAVIATAETDGRFGIELTAVVLYVYILATPVTLFPQGIFGSSAVGFAKPPQMKSFVLQ